MFVGHRRSLKEDKRIKTRTKVLLKYDHEFISKVFRICIYKVEFNFTNILYHRKFMRHVRRQNPEKRCLIQYDKLLIDGKMFVYNDFKGMVEEQILPPSMTLQEVITR